VSGGPAAVTGGLGSALVGVKQRLAVAAHSLFEPLVAACARLGIRADYLTVLGLVFSFGSALAFFEGWFRRGAVFAALAGLCDLLDGQLARRAGTMSRFGAFLDSTLDRFGEALVFVGIAGYYVSTLVELSLDPSLVALQISRGLEPRTWAAVALTAMMALVGSFMVSYTRARAEGLDLECRVGWFERPERLAVIIVAGLFGVGPVMPAALLILVFVTLATAAQRVVHVWRHTRAAGRDT
jgi:CDP-diacylglycerol--glycerol-3-phosphate 3-phosphatidyltransferase